MATETNSEVKLESIATTVLDNVEFEFYNLSISNHFPDKEWCFPDDVNQVRNMLRQKLSFELSIMMNYPIPVDTIQEDLGDFIHYANIENSGRINSTHALRRFLRKKILDESPELNDRLKEALVGNVSGAISMNLSTYDFYLRRVLSGDLPCEIEITNYEEFEYFATRYNQLYLRFAQIFNSPVNQDAAIAYVTQIKALADKPISLPNIERIYKIQLLRSVVHEFCNLLGIVYKTAEV